MDQLPVSLISADLKYALSSLKIKTFQKAKQYFAEKQQAISLGTLNLQSSVGVQDKLQKINKYLQKYNKIQNQVLMKINFGSKQFANEGEQAEIQGIVNLNKQRNHVVFQNSMSSNNHFNQNSMIHQKHSLIEQNEQSSLDRSSLTSSLNKIDKENTMKMVDQNDETYQRLSSQHQSLIKVNLNSIEAIIEYCFSKPGITEVTGQKGSGKTAFALYLAEIYASQSKTEKLYFINCTSGVTYTRFQRLAKKCNKLLQYCDSYELQHVLKVCQTALRDTQVGCVVIDGLTNLLMEEEKTLVFLLKLFKLFDLLLKNNGSKIILTNYVQQAFETVDQQEQLTNHYTYYSSVTSEFLRYKIFLKKLRRNRVQVRLIRGGSGRGEFLIGKDGVVANNRKGYLMDD